MNLPPRLSGTFSSSKICKSQKSLYGLKQSNRQWYFKLSAFLISLGYHQSHADYSLYVKYDAHHFTVLLVYVDVVVLTGNSIIEIQYVK